MTSLESARSSLHQEKTPWGWHLVYILCLDVSIMSPVKSSFVPSVLLLLETFAKIFCHRLNNTALQVEVPLILDLKCNLYMLLKVFLTMLNFMLSLNLVQMCLFVDERLKCVVTSRLLEHEAVSEGGADFTTLYSFRRLIHK